MRMMKQFYVVESTLTFQKLYIIVRNKKVKNRSFPSDFSPFFLLYSLVFASFISFLCRIIQNATLAFAIRK